MSASLPSRKNDARARRSRESLRGALLELIEQKSFEQVTVRDIARVAKVSYPTFFRNYASKADLLSDIGVKEIRSLLGEMTAIVHFHDVAMTADAICAFVGGKRSLWMTLLGSEAQFAMRAAFVRDAVEYANANPRITPGLPAELASSYLVGTIFEVLTWWFRQPEDVPVAEVSGFIQTLVLRQTMVPAQGGRKAAKAGAMPTA